MYPELQKNNLGEMEVFIWDHNKERVYDRAVQVLDDVTKSMADGIAFHWYSGDHFEALDLVRRKFPDLKMIVSESCIEYSKYGAADERKNAERLSHEIIGYPGAVRIAVTRYTDKIDVTAFENPDGKIVAILLNRSNEAVPVVLRMKEEVLKLKLEPGTITTGLI